VSPSEKTILVATDFGTTAELVLDRAIAFAQMMKARIVLLYACPVAYVTPFAGTIVPDSKMFAAAESALISAVARHAKSGVDITCRIEMGDPRSVIDRVAAEIAAVLIVMGTHGRRGVSRLFLGSTAEAIVRSSVVPVLTIRDDHDEAAKRASLTT
jgi:nucleotide-binding universal stress UspA family protein